MRNLITAISGLNMLSHSFLPSRNWALPQYSLRGQRLTGTSTINALILDYLTMEGYPKAAANFSEEANLSPQQDEPSITARQEIQHAIHLGHINQAINALNALDPEVCSLPVLSYSPFPSAIAMIRKRFMHHA